MLSNMKDATKTIEVCSKSYLSHIREDIQTNPEAPHFGMAFRAKIEPRGGPDDQNIEEYHKLEKVAVLGRFYKVILLSMGPLLSPSWLPK